MKLVFSLLALARLASGECPNTIELTGECNLAALSEAADCDIAGEWFGVDSGVATDLIKAEASIKERCDEAVEGNTRNFEYVTYEGSNYKTYQRDNSYFDGGTYWNDAQETRTEVLRSGDTGSIKRFYNDYASNAIIGWPGKEGYNYPDNFKNCDARVAMCCFIDNRFKDIDLDPNADICYHDLHDSRHSNHINRGFAVFDDREEKAYCHAIAWSADEDALSARYKGNALFYISMYDGLYQNGFVKNIPSSPLCACIEQMATVDDADCTKVNVVEKYTFTGDSSGFSATLSSDIKYRSCGKSIISHYGDMASQEEVEELGSNHIVDDCESANTEFLNSKFFVPSEPRTFNVDLTKWATVMGQGIMRSYAISESELRTFLTESPNGIIWRKCLFCTNTHKEIYYKRITDLPPPEELDFLGLLQTNWYSSPSNTLNVDFELYSSYEEAVAGTGKWMFCNYNDEQTGFPRDCGPTKKTDHNWNSYVKHSGHPAKHHAFYVERSLASQS